MYTRSLRTAASMLPDGQYASWLNPAGACLLCGEQRACMIN
jgi:hypothetical protein